MKKKRILICGASGFIGRNITEALAGNKDIEVYGTYFKKKPYPCRNVNFIKADLREKSDVEKAVKGKDIIIQAAATTSGAKDIINRPYDHVTDNALMNSLILMSAYENRIKHFIFFSCTIMYQSGRQAVKEDSFDANKEIYPAYFGAGWTKVYIEKMCEFYSRISNMKFTVIRHSNIYGPYDKFDPERSHVFAATIAKILTCRKGADIVVWGNGSAERDLLYVSDLVSFVKQAIARQKVNFRIFNVGSGSAISVKDLVKKIAVLSGNNISIKYDKTKPDIKTRLCLDCRRARKELGWQPRISLDNGIRMTMDWYRKNVIRKEGKNDNQ